MLEIVKATVDVIDMQGALVGAEPKLVQSRVIVGRTQSNQWIDKLLLKHVVVVFNDFYHSTVGCLRGLCVAAVSINTG